MVTKGGDGYYLGPFGTQQEAEDAIVRIPKTVRAALQAALTFLASTDGFADLRIDGGPRVKDPAVTLSTGSKFNKTG